MASPAAPIQPATAGTRSDWPISWSHEADRWTEARIVAASAVPAGGPCRHGGRAGAGAVLSALSALQRVIQPELFAGWEPGAIGIMPVLIGLPVGPGMALAPATGAVAGLFVQAWNTPFPSLKSQARAAAWGAGSASALLAGATLFLTGADPVATLAAGAAYAFVSFCWRPRLLTGSCGVPGVPGVSRAGRLNTRPQQPVRCRFGRSCR